MEPSLKIILSFIIPLFFLLSMQGCIQTNTPATDNFSFSIVTGETKNLSDYHGHAVLLDFMGVACQPCQQEMFILAQLHQNFSNLSIISIDVWTTQGETTQSIQQLKDTFQQQYGIVLDWTFGLDDAQGTLGSRFASDGVPHLYLYTKQGNLYYTHLGYEAYSTLAAQVEALLD